MIVPETLEKIASAAAASGELSEDTLLVLKNTWPDIRFTICNDDDMPARLPAALRREKFNPPRCRRNPHLDHLQH